MAGRNLTARVEALEREPAPPRKPEYEVISVRGGWRYKIVHRPPTGKVKEAVYFVQVYGREDKPTDLKIGCSCPDARHRNPGRCKHCKGIAALIGKPWLVKPAADPNF